MVRLQSNASVHGAISIRVNLAGIEYSQTVVTAVTDSIKINVFLTPDYKLLGNCQVDMCFEQIPDPRNCHYQCLYTRHTSPLNRLHQNFLGLDYKLRDNCRNY